MFFARSRRVDVLPIGLHIGADVRLAQFSSRGALIALHQTPLPASSNPTTPRATAHVLRQALRAGGFVGTKVVASLPPSLVHLRTFRMAAPSSGGAGAEGLASAALREAGAGVPFGADDAQVEAIPVGEVRRGLDVRHEFLSVAARRTDITTFVERLGAEIQVVSLQADPFAAYRSAAWLSAPARSAVVLAVQVADVESAVLVGQGPQLRVVRRLPVGSAALDLAVARRLGVPVPDAHRLRLRAAAAGPVDPPHADSVRVAIGDALRGPLEELAREVLLCARYHALSFRCAMPTSLRLLGTEAADKQLCASLASATGLPVDPRGVLASAKWDAGRTPRGATSGIRHVNSDDGGWAVALGLALKLAPDRRISEVERDTLGVIAPVPMPFVAGEAA